MDNKPQSSGICQRLFRLVLGAVSRPSSALPPPPPRSMNGHNCEVAVELRHHTVDHHSTKGTLILSGDQTKLPKDGVIHERGGEKEHHGKKSVSIVKGSERERNIKGRERKEVTIHDDETKPRRHWPLLSVASNINEKSEAFIERKRKAMKRYYSLDQDRSDEKFKH